MSDHRILGPIFFPFEKMIKTPNKEDKTPLIYYGGKSRDADWIISNFPHGWTTLVDVFGGGGAISFRVGIRRRVIVYNDIGNVVHFMLMLREHGDELYRALYFTPYSRDEFEHCRDHWRERMDIYQQWKNVPDGIEWARQWYTVINQGYTHEETSDSWHKAIQVNSGSALANHTDDLPKFVDRLRRMHVENMDFSRIILEYDLESTLFYCDPPYLNESRVDFNNYLNELSVERHIELIELLKTVKGQVVLSGYASDLYDSRLKGWRRAERTHMSSIQNTKSINGRGTRTEVLWIKEHQHGLWGSVEGVASPNVSGLLPSW